MTVQHPYAPMACVMADRVRPVRPVDTIGAPGHVKSYPAGAEAGAPIFFIFVDHLQIPNWRRSIGFTQSDGVNFVFGSIFFIYGELVFFSGSTQWLCSVSGCPVLTGVLLTPQAG